MEMLSHLLGYYNILLAWVADHRLMRADTLESAGTGPRSHRHADPLAIKAKKP